MDFNYKNIDDTIHSRVRLAIMAFLATAVEAEFSELKKQVKVSDGNLSTHLKKLDEAGYITVTKQFVANKPQTTVALTDLGKKAFEEYVNSLTSLIQQN